MAHKRSRPSWVEKDEDPQTSSENPPDSPLSGDDACRAAAATTATTASPSFNKKRRRGIQKRVVSVPIGELGGSRSSSTFSKGDAYPPSDSWTWRKYGQKPIKGSPYPRGYYRCSSSKGCPARKQVERSHVDPAVLVITYASDHNHPTPTSSKHHQHHHRSLSNGHNSSINGLSSFIPTAAAAAVTDSSDAEAAAPTTPSTTNSAAAGNDMPSDYSEELFTDPVPDHFEMDGDTLLGAGTTMPTFEHFRWLTDVVSFDDLYLVGPRCDDADMAMLPVMREEDESLFADLGELPECSAVFRSGRGMEIKV